MIGACSGVLLSLGCEVLQNWLPSRVPSNLDWGLNSIGALTGASLSVFALAMGGANYWQSWRDRWLVERSSGGMTLLLLWPLALLFPLPVLLGVGQIADRVRIAVAELLADTPAALWWAEVVLPLQARAPLLPPTEFMITALGQLLPCMVVYAISPIGWRRIIMALSTGVVGLATTTLSTALNFGPQHALTWATRSNLAAWACALMLVLLLFWLSTRAAALLGLLIATALIVQINQAPSDPYFAASLQAWELGRFVHFHGAAQWVGWLWPYAAMLYLWVISLSLPEAYAPRPNVGKTLVSKMRQ
jgi:hypothetical protein